MTQSTAAHLKEIKAESGEFRLFAGNIIQFQPSEIASKDTEKTAEGLIIFDELCEGELAGAIVDLRKLKKGVTKEVRDYTAKHLHGKLFGTALLVESGLSKIIGNIMLNFLPKGPHKRKIFNSLEESISWLNKQKNNQER